MQRYDKSYGKHFGSNLHRLRTERGLTLRELASDVGLTLYTVWRYEHGDLPTMLCSLILADYFGVALDELIKPNN